MAYDFCPKVESPGKCICLILMAPFIIIVAIIVFALAPVVGILAVPILGIKALYHTARLNYAWRQSRNEQGVALAEQTDLYMKRGLNLGATDLPRLYQERTRIEQRDTLFETLKWVRGMSKCIIPVVGIVWAIASEMQTGGSIEVGCSGCNEHWSHWSDKDAIEWHIQQLERAKV